MLILSTQALLGRETAKTAARLRLGNEPFLAGVSGVSREQVKAGSAQSRMSTQLAELFNGKRFGVGWPVHSLIMDTDRVHGPLDAKSAYLHFVEMIAQSAQTVREQFFRWRS